MFDDVGQLLAISCAETGQTDEDWVRARATTHTQSSLSESAEVLKPKFHEPESSSLYLSPSRGSLPLQQPSPSLLAPRAFFGATHKDHIGGPGSGAHFEIQRRRPKTARSCAAMVRLAIQTLQSP